MIIFFMKKSKFAWTGRRGVRPTELCGATILIVEFWFIFEVPEPQGFDKLIRLNMTVFE